MSLLRNITSGKITLLLTAVLTGIYLFLSFGHQDPWLSLTSLLRDNMLVSAIVLLSAVHFLGKAVYRLSPLRFSSIGPVLFFLSLPVLIVGILFSLHTRDTRIQRLKVSDVTHAGLRATEISFQMPEEILMVGEHDTFAIHSVRADIEENGRPRALTSFPFSRTESAYAFINNAGISPDIRVRIGDSEQSFSMLDLLPPGRTVSVPLGTGHTMEIGLSEESSVNGESIRARRYDLRHLKYRIVIQQSGTTLLDRIFTDNEVAREGTIILKTGSTERWIEVVALRDASLLMLYAGLCGLFLGILLYPVEFFYRLSS